MREQNSDCTLRVVGSIPELAQTNLNFSLCRNCFFSRLFASHIASCMHWEDEFRCISLIFGKFNVILVVFCL